MKKAIISALILLLSTVTFADNETGFGEVVSLRVIGNSESDAYVLYRGILVVNFGSEENVFHWGGSTCPGKDLTDPKVALLQNAALAPYMRISLMTKSGQGGSACITGMTFKNVKFQTPQ